MESPEKLDFCGSGLIYEKLVEMFPDKASVLMFGPVLRNANWLDFSREFLKTKVCAVCGGKYRLVAHHKIPWYLRPDLELVEDNLIPLCEGRNSCNCHLTFGHLGNWRMYNRQVVEDSTTYGLHFRQARIR